MEIFFSLSQPDGLVEEGGRYEPNTGCQTSPCRRTHAHTKHLHEDSISFHHLCRVVERKAIESVDQIFVEDVQVLHLLH